MLKLISEVWLFNSMQYRKELLSSYSRTTTELDTSLKQADRSCGHQRSCVWPPVWQGPGGQAQWWGLLPILGSSAGELAQGHTALCAHRLLASGGQGQAPFRAHTATHRCTLGSTHFSRNLTCEGRATNVRACKKEKKILGPSSQNRHHSSLIRGSPAPHKNSFVL